MSKSKATDRPRKLAVELVETADTLLITLKTRRGNELFQGIFLVVFMPFWTFACIAFTTMAIKTEQYHLLFFALFAWAPLVLFAYLICKIFFGQESLAVTPDGIVYERKVFWTFGHRRIPRVEILSVESTHLLLESTIFVQKFTVEIITTGNKQLFGKGLSKRECEWLAQKIEDSLNHHDAEQDPSDRFIPKDSTVSERIVIHRPSECEWTLDDDGHSLSFRNAGRLDWSLLLGTLFLNLMFNGFLVGWIAIVVGGVGPGKAVKPLNGGGWLCLALILVHFVIPSLAMLFGLFKAIMEPFRRTLLTVGQNEIERQDRWLCWNRKKQFVFENECRLEVRKTVKKTWRNGKIAAVIARIRNRYDLVVLDRDGLPVYYIGNMTQGDAQWMKAEIESRRPDWFMRDHPSS